MLFVDNSRKMRCCLLITVEKCAVATNHHTMMTQGSVVGMLAAVAEQQMAFLVKI